jgi:hypothetical protein
MADPRRGPPDPFSVNSCRAFRTSVHWSVDAGSGMGRTRVYLNSAQAANRGTRRKRNSADLATIGESVVRVFLKSPTAILPDYFLGLDVM